MKEDSCLDDDAALPFKAMSELSCLPLIITELGALDEGRPDDSIENASSWDEGGKFKSKMLRSESGFVFAFEIKSKP